VKVPACLLLMFLIGSSYSAAPAQTADDLAKTPHASTQDSANELFVPVGKSALIDVARPIQRIAVGLGDVAEATAISPQEILVNGKTAGDTSLIVWESGGGRQFYNVVVRPSPGIAGDRLEGLRRELRTELPGQPVRVSSEDGLVFLRGTVKDMTSSARAVQIASTAGKVVNLLYVDVPASQPQILLKVRFAAVDRSLEKQLGLNLFSLGAANSIGSVTTGQFGAPSFTPPSTGVSSTTAALSNLGNLFIFRPDLNLGATLEALQTRGLLEVLAEPNVLTVNGKQASFLAGGEYPYPVVQGVTGGGGSGAVTIQFKEFGVRLNFIPTITPRNTIRLQVAPEVSALDFTNGVTIGGFTVPGLTVRRVKTDVELREGQSFAIGGLLDNRETETFNKIPFIGDVPVLGKLFQSIQRTKTNTELIVIVTPEVVAPIPAGAPLPQVNFPVPFLPSNSNHAMINPGPEVTGAKPLPEATSTMPVEKLIESMQPEQPLVIEGGMSTSGYGTQGGGGSTGASTSVVPQ
jgi:pilus assembly protein CpaC